MHSTHPLPTAFRADASFWIPEPQQSLIDVVASVYGLYSSDGQAFEAVLYYLHRLNPQVFNVTAPMGAIVLKIIDFHVSGPQSLVAQNKDAVVKHLQTEFRSLDFVYQSLCKNLPSKKEDLQAYRLTVGFLSEVGPTSATLAGLGMGMMQNTTSAPLQLELKNLLNLHQQRKIGNLSDKQFKLAQEQIIRRVRKALGWTEKYHFGYKTARQALYSKHSHGFKPTRKVMEQLEHVKFLNRVTKGGGLLLTAIGLKMSCGAISESPADQKVLTTYSEIGGFSGSLIGGFAFGLIELSGPVSWVVGLGIALGAGYAASELGSAAGKKIYSKYGDIFYLSNSALVKNWCGR